MRPERSGLDGGASPALPWDAAGNTMARRMTLFPRLLRRAFPWAARVVAAVASLATSAAAGVRVPAFTAYTSPDANAARISERSGVKGWTDPAQVVDWHGLFRATGALSASVALTLPEGAESRLRLTVGGTSREATARGEGVGKPLTLSFGGFEVARTGHARFRLESLNARGQPAGDLEALVLEGPATEGVHFNLKERRNAASVHLAYPSPTTNKAPVTAFHCEVTAVEDPVTTFYMACGWHRGYFGMQVNSPGERRIIFSVWDSGGEAMDRGKVSDENRVKLVAKGDGVYTGDFGNEGTGGHSHLKYPWKTGQPQRFLVTSTPTDGTFTVFAGYYLHPDTREWMLVSAWRAPKEGGGLRGLHSFSENFWGSTGHLVRKARYGRQWLQQADGAWHEMTAATFSHDPTGKADRLDRFMGVEDGTFFLSHGGFLDGFTPYGQRFERPATGRVPDDLGWVVPGMPPQPHRP